MTRIIDADALIDELHFCGEDRAIGIVDSAPTIEPREYLKTIPTVYLLEALGVGSVDELMGEPSGDLISRADAVKVVHKFFVEEINKQPYHTDEDGDEVYTDMGTVNNLFRMNKAISKGIKTVPSVSAERVGVWHDVENEPYCECSVCGAYIDNLDDDYAFCPRCGAKMGVSE